MLSIIILMFVWGLLQLFLGTRYLKPIFFKITVILNFIIFLVCSFLGFYEVMTSENVTVIYLFDWIDIGIFNMSIGLLLDSISIIMVFIVIFISFLVHVYSFSYMREDPHFYRFLSYLSIFTFFMLILVTSNNYLQLLLGWEGVGLSSYLLICFWYTRISANLAAIKAMSVNRIGDIFLLFSIFLIYKEFGSLEFGVVFNNVIYVNDIYFDLFFFEIRYLDLLCFFLFMAACGKSAQLLLHVWLPDAMEGPTPVSALIHAATMVTAGVFLVIRSSALFEFSVNILFFMVFLGSLTCFLMSLLGAFQQDIKKIVAYSTCSQLGYMFMGCGLSSYNTSFFHLFNHAFFKALLFLSMGVIIHALSDEQDLRKMGNLVNFLPFTILIVFFGNFALLGLPFLAGFFSKDILIEVAFARFYFDGGFSYILALSAAFFTAFYSTRLFFRIFFSFSNFNRYTIFKIHEVDFSMFFSLFFLLLCSYFVGYLFFDMFIGLGSSFFFDNIFIDFSNYSGIIMEFESSWNHFIFNLKNSLSNFFLISFFILKLEIFLNYFFIYFLNLNFNLDLFFFFKDLKFINILYNTFYDFVFSWNLNYRNDNIVLYAFPHTHVKGTALNSQEYPRTLKDFDNIFFPIYLEDAGISFLDINEDLFYQNKYYDLIDTFVNDPKKVRNMWSKETVYYLLNFIFLKNLGEIDIDYVVYASHLKENLPENVEDIHFRYLKVDYDYLFSFEKENEIYKGATRMVQKSLIEFVFALENWDMYTKAVFIREPITRELIDIKLNSNDYLTLENKTRVLQTKTNLDIVSKFVLERAAFYYEFTSDFLLDNKRLIKEASYRSIGAIYKIPQFYAKFPTFKTALNQIYLEQQFALFFLNDYIILSSDDIQKFIIDFYDYLDKNPEAIEKLKIEETPWWIEQEKKNMLERKIAKIPRYTVEDDSNYFTIYNSNFNTLSVLQLNFMDYFKVSELEKEFNNIIMDLEKELNNSMLYNWILNIFDKVKLNRKLYLDLEEELNNNILYNWIFNICDVLQSRFIHYIINNIGFEIEKELNNKIMLQNWILNTFDVIKSSFIDYIKVYIDLEKELNIFDFSYLLNFYLTKIFKINNNNLIFIKKSDLNLNLDIFLRNLEIKFFVKILPLIVSILGFFFYYFLDDRYFFYYNNKYFRLLFHKFFNGLFFDKLFIDYFLTKFYIFSYCSYYKNVESSFFQKFNINIFSTIFLNILKFLKNFSKGQFFIYLIIVLYFLFIFFIFYLFLIILNFFNFSNVILLFFFCVSLNWKKLKYGINTIFKK